MIKNKKAAISDLAIILGVILTMAITIIVVNLVWDEYQRELGEAIDLSKYPRVQASMDKTTNQSMPMLDRIFLAIVIALFLGTIILGFQLRTSPIFIAFIFIYMPLLILLAKIMKDVYNEFRLQENLATIASTLTITNSIMGNLPVIITGFAILLSIVLYAIRRNESL